MIVFAGPDFGDPDRIWVGRVVRNDVAQAAGHAADAPQQDRDEVVAPPRRGGAATTHILAATDIVTGYCFVPATLDALVTTALTVPTARSTALLRVAATHEGSTTVTRTRALASGSGDTATADGGALDWRAILDLTRDVAAELECTLQASS